MPKEIASDNDVATNDLSYDDKMNRVSSIENKDLGEKIINSDRALAVANISAEESDDVDNAGMWTVGQG